MKKYKLTKDLGLTRTGWIFDIEWYYYWNNINELIKMEINEEVKDIIKYTDYFPDYFQEVFELKEQLPKFKVWDYVVWNKHTSFSWDVYIKIHSIHTIDNEFAYNFEKFRENNLRLPTEEELKKYFR